MMHIEAAVASDVAGEHVGKRDIDHPSASTSIAHIERQQAARSEHGTSLMFDDAGWQREWCAARFTKCPRGRAQGLRINTRPGMARERAVEAKGGGDADDQLRMTRRQLSGWCGACSERAGRIAQQNVAFGEQRIERRSGGGSGQHALAFGQHVEREGFGMGRARRIHRAAVQARDRRPHARQQPAGVGRSNSAARPFEYAHAACR